MSKLLVTLLTLGAAVFIRDARAAPLFEFPAPPAQWRVDIVPSPAGLPVVELSGNALGIKKIEITRVGGLSRSIITWSTGKTSERWLFGDSKIAISTDTYNGAPAILAKEDLALGGDFAVGFDAAFFQWLKPELLKDSVSYNGIKCSHYAGDVVVTHIETVEGRDREVSVTFHCQAWIDEQTLLPIAAYDGSKMGNFTYLAPPTGPLIPPAAIARVAARFEEASRPLK